MREVTGAASDAPTTTQMLDGFKVLDKGYVKLIDCMGTDESIIEAARMSVGRGFISWEPYERCTKCEACYQPRPDGLTYAFHPAAPHPMWTHNDKSGCGECGLHLAKMPRGDLGLLETLWSSGHSTPFEMVELAIEVQAPLMVFREWHRHRTQSYSEFSARYAQMPNLHYLPELSRVQKQSKTMRQGSGEALPEADAQAWLDGVRMDQEDIYSNYNTAIEHGIANELARINTPVSRYSKMRAKTDLRNWFGFLALRLAPTAQYEIRQYAEAVAKIIKALWPRSYALFEEHTLGAVRFSATEIETLRGIIDVMSTTAPVPTEALPLSTLGGKAKRDAFLKKIGRKIEG